MHSAPPPPPPQAPPGLGSTSPCAPTNAHGCMPCCSSEQRGSRCSSAGRWWRRSRERRKCAVPAAAVSGLGLGLQQPQAGTARMISAGMPQSPGQAGHFVCMRASHTVSFWQSASHWGWTTRQTDSLSMQGCHAHRSHTRSLQQLMSDARFPSLSSWPLTEHCSALDRHCCAAAWPKLHQ